MMNCCEINFEIEEQNIDFCIEDHHLNFNTDFGYVVTENNSYSPLTEKPMINYKILQSGNNTYEYLGVEPTIIDITEQDIDNMLYGG